MRLQIVKIGNGFVVSSSNDEKDSYFYKDLFDLCEGIKDLWIRHEDDEARIRSNPITADEIDKLHDERSSLRFPHPD